MKTLRMKRLIFILSLVFICIVGCQFNSNPKVISVSQGDETAPKEVIAEVSTAKIVIEGMTCTIGCAATIEKKLNQTAGIVSATVDFESKTAWVLYDAMQLNHDEIQGVVQSVGGAYRVSAIETIAQH